MFHGSPFKADRYAALDHWEDLVETWGDDECFWPTRLPACSLSRSLLDGATQNDPSLESGDAPEFGARLEELCGMDLAVFRDDQDESGDLRLTLARFYTLTGDHERAKESVRDRMRVAFDAWPEPTEKEELAKRYDTIAHSLKVLDDDINVVAASQLWEPTRPSDYASFCDGCVARMAGDLWVCKHCLDVTLCMDCHGKLLLDGLSPYICNSRHSFLYLPPFDQAA